MVVEILETLSVSVKLYESSAEVFKKIKVHDCWNRGGSSAVVPTSTGSEGGDTAAWAEFDRATLKTSVDDVPNRYIHNLALVRANLENFTVPTTIKNVHLS